MTNITDHKDGSSRLRRLAELDTSSLPRDGGPYYNRLVFARSPYLLQHAENPVDWYPWCEEAFKKAQQEDKPVFLSIGYATCHWCHVMERESFEDEQVAAFLNEHFVSIKVDREERPDIDDQYMTVSRMLTGGGGWPLTILMTADRHPFYATTYIPRAEQKGMPGIIDVLQKVHDLWETDRNKIMENCSMIVNALADEVVVSAGSLTGDVSARQAFEALEKAYDEVWGGFGEAPKFPLPHYTAFLIRYWKRTGNERARRMAEHTLEMIRRGGIFDQVGLGTHRYSVDKAWLVPHFEKMLYDQAMMSLACLDVGKATGDGRFTEVAKEIFTFVLNGLTSPQGGFYSAWDADTDGTEGEHYTWTPEEVADVLGDGPATTLGRLFGITGVGNFEGRNILSLQESVEEFAAREGIAPDVFREMVEEWRKDLLAARNLRPKPLRDEKILTAWNGLMIAAFARGFALTGIRHYRDAADRALNFIRGNLFTEEGRLMRNWYRGSATVPAFLEDYSFIVWGLLELYEATLEQGYLDEARSLSKKMIRLFQDPECYGFFDSALDMEDVLIRKKGGLDGVTPSGNAVAALNLIRLGKIGSDTRLLEEGKGALRAFMGSVAAHPTARLQFLIGLDYLNGPDLEISLVGRLDSEETRAMIHTVHRRFIPCLVLRFSEGTDCERTVAHVCTEGSCRMPATGAAELDALLDEIDTSP